MSVSSSTPRASFEQVLKQAYYIHRETVKDFQGDIADWRLKCDKIAEENNSLVCKSGTLQKALEDSKSENKSFIEVIDTLRSRSDGAICQTCVHLQASMAAIQEAYTQSLREKDKMIKFLEDRIAELTASNEIVRSNPIRSTARSDTGHLPAASGKMSSPESDPDSITSRSDRCHRLRLQHSNVQKRCRYVEVNGHDNKRQKSSPTLITRQKDDDSLSKKHDKMQNKQYEASENVSTDHRIFVPETMDVNDDTSFQEADDNATNHFVPETEMLDSSVSHNINEDFKDQAKHRFNFEKKSEKGSKVNSCTSSTSIAKNRTMKNCDMDCTLNTILNDMNETIIDNDSQNCELTDDNKTTPTKGKINFDEKLLNVVGGKRPKPVVLLSPLICDSKRVKEVVIIKSPSLFDDDNCTTSVKKSIKCEKKNDTSKNVVKSSGKNLQKSSIDHLTNQHEDEEIGSQSPSLLHSKFEECVQDKLVGTSFLKSQENRREYIVDRKLSQKNLKPTINLTNERATKTSIHRKLQKDSIDMTLNDSIEDLDVTIRRSLRQTTMSQAFISPSLDRGRKYPQNIKRVDSEDKDLEKAIRISLTEIQNSPEKMDQKRNFNSKSQCPVISGMSENSPPFKKPGKPSGSMKHTAQKARIDERCVETAFDPDETLPPITQSKITSPKSENKTKGKIDSHDCRLITLDMNGSLDPDVRLSQYDAEDDIGDKQEVVFMEEESQPIASSYKFGAGRRRKVQISRQQCVDLEDEPVEIPEPLNVNINCSFDRVPKKQGVNYAYLDVVRKQDDRKLLTGHKCQECWEYYEAAGLSEEEIGKRVQTCSRHRARFVPPGTPEHFWSIGFPDTEVCEERGYTNKDLTTKPSTFRRRKQLTKTFKTENEDKMDPKSSHQKSESNVSDIEFD